MHISLTPTSTHSACAYAKQSLKFLRFHEGPHYGLAACATLGLHLELKTSLGHFVQVLGIEGHRANQGRVLHHVVLQQHLDGTRCVHGRLKERTTLKLVC